MMKKILITGGAGYIGTHTCIELINAGFQPVIIDNLSNSSLESIKRVEKLTQIKIPFYEVDIRDRIALREVINEHNVEACIHFAGLKAVGESVEEPLKYYDNNVGGSIILFEELQISGCRTLIFSSSATIYGDPEKVPITECAPAGKTTNPYGRSKWIIEEILRDIFQSDSKWKIGLLRYFNPVGAHESGLIGEDPCGIPNNLMPYIAQTAIGEREFLNIFGSDYPTKDGTGVRDYIHVVDLAIGHVKTLEYLFQREEQLNGRLITLNLGSGKGTSVLELVKAFEAATNTRVPYKLIERRQGDIAICYADPTLANEILNWKTERNIYDMCQDTWHWQTKNPKGFING